MQMKVTHKEKGIAHISINFKGTELKILLSNKSWKKIKVLGPRRRWPRSPMADWA